MAAEEAPAKAAGKGLDFLKTKIGPVPLGVWLVIGLGVFLYVQRSSSKTAAGGTQTDPAGNTGTINPATGYVYNSPEDKAAQSGLNSPSTSGGGNDTGGGSNSTTAGTYATNADWERAALNYLVGRGIDPAVATQALQNYLSSQPLPTDEQADVNLAIQALGAPPQLPSNTQTNPNPVGSVNASNPVTGLAINPRDTSAHTLSLQWTPVANASGYTVGYGKAPGQFTWSTSTPGGQPGVTIGVLDPGTTYYFRVQATPAASGAAWSETVSGTTANS